MRGDAGCPCLEGDPVKRLYPEIEARILDMEFTASSKSANEEVRSMAAQYVVDCRTLLERINYLYSLVKEDLKR